MIEKFLANRVTLTETNPNNLSDFTVSSIPFRIARIVVYAEEVLGSDNDFPTTCEYNVDYDGVYQLQTTVGPIDFNPTITQSNTSSSVTFNTTTTTTVPSPSTLTLKAWAIFESVEK